MISKDLKIKFWIGLVAMLLLFLVKTCEEKQNVACLYENEAKFQEFNDVIKSKFPDRNNHMISTIVLQNQGDKITRIFIHEKSGFYDKLLVGDTIIKVKNDLGVILKRGKMIINLELEYRCD